MKYEVLAGDAVVGWSELEAGDPPMGVAFGCFHPVDAYARLRSTLQSLEIRVRPEGGEFLNPAGGAYIQDCSAEVGFEAIEVSVLGLGQEEYTQHFPAHVRAYDERFAK